MRWLFVLLLVLNAFYYVWSQQQIPQRARDVVPMAPYPGAQGALKLLTKADRERVRESQPAQQPVVEEAACLFLGDFSEESGARALEQRLRALGIQADLRSLEGRAGLDYSVYLAPLASRQAAMRQLKELQARSIDSYLISEGPLNNGISLGFFPREDSALGVLNRLREAGYEPQLLEVPRARHSYWLRISEAGQRLAEDALSVVAVDFPDLRQHMLPCQAVAIPE